MTPSNSKISAAEARKLRLSQALRDNMKRRKQQVRGRASAQIEPHEGADDPIKDKTD